MMMKRQFFLMFFLLILLQASAQLIYKTLNGRVDFSSVKGMNLIEAYSENLFVKFVPASKQINFKVQISSFSFTNCSKLVEKTFNDTYMESNRYHWAKFEGKIVNDSLNLLIPATIEIEAEGVLNIHGIEKFRKIKGQITIKEENVLSFNAKFYVPLTDHNIVILTEDIDRLAGDIEVKINAEVSLIK